MAIKNPAIAFMDEVQETLQKLACNGITSVDDTEYGGKALFLRFIDGLQLTNDQWLLLLWLAGDAIRLGGFEPAVEDRSRPDLPSCDRGIAVMTP